MVLLGTEQRDVLLVELVVLVVLVELVVPRQVHLSEDYSDIVVRQLLSRVVIPNLLLSRELNKWVVLDENEEKDEMVFELLLVALVQLVVLGEQEVLEGLVGS